MTTETASKLAKTYLKMRDARDKVKAELEEKVKVIEDQMDIVSSSMMEICKETDSNSINTDYGTIIRSIKSRYWASDMAMFGAFVLEYEAPNLYESRIHQGNMKTFLDENPEVSVPTLNVDSKYAITVRRPKN